jgi:hypothetical protein
MKINCFKSLNFRRVIVTATCKPRTTKEQWKCSPQLSLYIIWHFCKISIKENKSLWEVTEPSVVKIITSLILIWTLKVIRNWVKSKRLSSLSIYKNLMISQTWPKERNLTKKNNKSFKKRSTISKLTLTLNLLYNSTSMWHQPKFDATSLKWNTKLHKSALRVRFMWSK